MPQAMPHTDFISQNSSKSSMFRTKIAQFGNGYTQRVNDGINNQIDSWTVMWENVTEAQKDTIITALDAVAGSDYLTWTPNGETNGKKFRIVDGYSVQVLSGDIYSVSVQIEQVFDL